mmetsp:Transcript_8836/g.9410  ORF Transcript_8836/g.9410 Transcript_8836/m.9410 type:complete len:158 (-) Transcript_8836:200-673(-)
MYNYYYHSYYRCIDTTTPCIVVYSCCLCPSSTTPPITSVSTATITSSVYVCTSATDIRVVLILLYKLSHSHFSIRSFDVITVDVDVLVFTPSFSVPLSVPMLPSFVVVFPFNNSLFLLIRDAIVVDNGVCYVLYLSCLNLFCSFCSCCFYFCCGWNC